jgi:PilZ domain
MQSSTPGTWAASRRHGRFLIDLRLIVKTSTTLHGRTRNLSEGGLGATVAGDIPIGEIVQLQLQLPGSEEPLVLFAELRYRQGFQYGFKFVNPSDKQVEIIRRSIRDLPLEK